MKRIEIEIVEGTRDDGRRLRRIAEILASGVYAFLEEEGYLKDGERGEKGLRECGADVTVETGKQRTQMLSQ